MAKKPTVNEAGDPAENTQEIVNAAEATDTTNETNLDETKEEPALVDEVPVGEKAIEEAPLGETKEGVIEEEKPLIEPSSEEVKEELVEKTSQETPVADSENENLAAPAEEIFVSSDGGADFTPAPAPEPEVTPAPAQEEPKGDGAITDEKSLESDLSEDKTEEVFTGSKVDEWKGKMAQVDELTPDEEVLEACGKLLNCDHTTGGLKAKINQQEGKTFKEKAQNYCQQWLNPLAQE